MRVKKAWVVFFAALAVILPLRLYQQFFLVDEGTGFYTDGFFTTSIILGLLLAAAVLLTAFCRGKDALYGEYRAESSFLAAAGAFLAGASLLVQSFYTLVLRGGKIHTIYLVLAGFGLLAGAVLLLTGVNFVKGGDVLHSRPLLGLLPPLWGCVGLITLFVTFTAVVNTADNLYATFTAIFILLFLFFRAKLISGLEVAKSLRNTYRYGFLAALFAVTSGVPAVAGRFALHTPEGAYPLELHLVNLALGVYAFLTLLSLRRAPAPAPAPAGEEPEPPRRELTPEELFLRGEETIPVQETRPEEENGMVSSAGIYLAPEGEEPKRLETEGETPASEQASPTIEETEIHAPVPPSRPEPAPASENPWEAFFADLPQREESAAAFAMPELAAGILPEPAKNVLQSEAELPAEQGLFWETFFESEDPAREAAQPGEAEPEPALPEPPEEATEEPREAPLRPITLQKPEPLAAGAVSEEMLHSIYGALEVFEEESEAGDGQKEEAPALPATFEEWLSRAYPGGKIFQERKSSPFYQK